MAESDSRSTNILSELIIMLVIAIVAIFLRFWSRIVAHSSASSSVRLWWDDWLALATLPFLIVFYSINIYWVGIGLGKHAADIPPQDVERGVILLGIDYIFFDTAISLPKLSALLFYARVFTVRGSPGSKVLRAFLWLAGALVVSWWIAAVVTSITQCMPLSKAWDPATPGHCFDIWTWWLTTAIFSTLIDLFILVIPLPSLWKLQLRPAKKVLITVVFICGYG
ncbi:hypothetical protein MMC10_010344, partial [Thelotrema lepadinum]|nr:hypothetical protein [Thelotrema lepadinum]